MASTSDFRRAFVERLNRACDEAPFVPERDKGRQNYIVEKLGVSPEAVSKWFRGIAMPRPDMMKKLAELLETDESWLALGVTPEVDRTSRKLQAKRSDAATHLVWGIVGLAGGHCGAPPDKDPRASYVDFYATYHGVVHPVHVTLARKLADDRYEVIVPKEYKEVRVIAVVQAGALKYHLLHLPFEVIEKCKTKKGGALAIEIERADRDRYVAGRTVIPNIRSFDDVFV